MRSEVSPQAGLFSSISTERWLPTDHPLRWIEAYADQPLATISQEPDRQVTRAGM
jgi:hypothetical protein